MIINGVHEVSQEEMKAKLDSILGFKQPLNKSVELEGSTVRTTYETKLARVIFESERATIKVLMHSTNEEFVYQHNVTTRDSVEYIHAQEFWHIYCMYHFALMFD